jgi:hypothetical protein
VNGEVWKKVVQKKKEEDLTGPTLLEMDDYVVNQADGIKKR